MEAKDLKLRTLTAHSIQKIVKFLVETGTEDLVGKFLFETQLPPITWAELRQKADLSAADLKKLQAEFGENAQVATLHIEKEKGIQIISQEVLSIQDLLKEAMHLVADDKKWAKLVNLVAYLYETDAKTIEELSFGDLKLLMLRLMGDSNFTEALQ